MAATLAADRGESVQERTLEDRILDAAEACVARWGVAKTTIDDLAREAGCSRATVYRAFPGGRDVVFLAAGARELQRFFDRLATEVAATETLGDALALALSTACSEIREHAALQFLLAHEPEVLEAHLAFDGLDPVLAWAAAFATVHLTRFLDPADAAGVGEWLARVVVTYALVRNTPLDLADPANAHRFVSTYLLPGLDAPSRP